MKYCPECQADVEGLLHFCDCCGAVLDTQAYLFSCFCRDFPECLGFLNLSVGMLREIEPAEPNLYSDFLKEVQVELICLPEGVITQKKLKNRVYYSGKRKFARVTLIVNYCDYVLGTKEDKSCLVASAIKLGLQLLQARLHKDKVNIEKIVVAAEQKLAKYINGAGDGSLS